MKTIEEQVEEKAESYCRPQIESERGVFIFAANFAIPLAERRGFKKAIEIIENHTDYMPEQLQKLFEEGIRLGILPGGEGEEK